MQSTNSSPRSLKSIGYFSVGAVLLVLPLALVLLWGSASCSTNGPTPAYCVSPQTLKMAGSFFPFVMLIGAVLIGYRMKKISDSLLPQEEESDDDESQGHRARENNEG
jgi:hypothetical protein